MKNPFAWPYAEWVPVLVRRVLFHFAPGTWTAVEVADQRHRATELKKILDDLTE